MSSSSPIAPLAVSRLDLTIGAGPSPYGLAHAEEIAAEWAVRAAANPDLWNGPIFLFEDIVADAARGFSAIARSTDFATFLHWRERADPTSTYAHVFPVAAVTTADDHLLLGIMGATTANPNRAYPPSGSFDDDDRLDGRLDAATNIRRELREEVGIDVADLVPEGPWWVIPSGPRRFALVRRHRSGKTVAEMATEIDRHLATEGDGELSGVRFVPFDRPLPERETVPYVNPLLTLLASR
jgi:8-oxo-dGTP pyrophosphatase MutT (NUDIX family)